MKTFPLSIRRCPRLFGALVPLIALTTWQAMAETEDVLEKSLTVAPGGTLAVEVEFGAIEVSTHAGSEATVKAWRKVKQGDQTEEEAYLQDRPVIVSQDGDTITVRSGPERKGNAQASPLKGVRNVQAKYTVTVPSRFNVQLKTGSGSISVRDLQGESQTSSVGGDLTFANVKGALEGKTGGGRVRITECEGALKVKSTGGTIDVARGGGSFDGQTGGGAVTVKEFQGPVSVKTGGGGIQIESVAGPISGATGGGSISASVPSVANEIKLTTGGGSVTLRAPESAAFDLDATTAAGSVTSDLPVSGEPKRSRQQLKGAVNGGGKPVHLRTGGGSVQIKRL